MANGTAGDKSNYIQSRSNEITNQGAKIFLNKSIKLERQYNWRAGSIHLKTYMGNHKMKLTGIKKKDVEKNFERKNN